MKMVNIPTSIKEENILSEKKVKEHSEKENPSLKNMKYLMILCFAIFLLYLPFQPLTNLQSTMNLENNVGMISQAIIYITNVLSCLFFPKLIIKKLGCKNTIVLCILTFVPYLAANYYPHMVILFPTACILGFGTGVLWSTVGYYINEISVLYAGHVIDTDVVISRFFGIFYMIFQNTQIWGNLITFYILKPYDTMTVVDNFSARNYTNETFENHLHKTGNVSCGANFCGGINENLMSPSKYKRYILMSTYLLFVVMSALVVLLFMDPLKQKGEKDESVLSGVAATGKHLKHANQLLLIPLTIFCGVEEVFIVGDFSKEYVACVSGLHSISLVYICFGVVNAIMSILSGRLVQYVPRASLLMIGAVINIGLVIVLLMWEPTADAFISFLIIVGVMAVCDAILRTQLHAFYGIIFKEEQEAAFANFNMWESFGFGLSFGYSGFLCMYQKIYILIAFIIVGITGYVIVEIRHCILNRTYNLSHSPQKS